MSLTRARDRRYPNRYRREHWTGVKGAIHQTIVSRRREEARDDRREQEDRVRDETGSAGDNFHTSLTVKSLSQRQIWKASTNGVPQS